MRIGIVTDSNSGITQAQAARMGVFVLPMPFTIDGQDYFEDISLTQQEFYEKLREGSDIATSQPSPEAVMNLWDQVLAGLEIPASGAVAGLAPEKAVLLFQENRLFPWRTAEQHITDVLPRPDRETAERWLSAAGLAGEGGSYPAALSGGMARRLAMLRALALGAQGCRWLLLDEPFTGVDQRRAEGLMEAVRGLRVPVLLCAHESHTLSLADRVVPLEGPPLRRREGEGP